MNTKLLQSWLGLPPGGPWPPDDRTLLGLPAGPVDPFAAERRAMEMMDKLRPLQLVHPDLVTEGMNRLAQALVALSTAGPAATPVPATPPPTRKAPRPTVSSAPTTRSAPPSPAPKYEAVDFALPETFALRPEPLEAEVVDAEVIPAEVVEAEVISAPVAAPRPVRRPPEPESDPRLSDFAPPAPAGFVVPATGRREAYRDLARLRQLRRAWRRLRSSVADPAEQLPGPAEVCGFLETVAEVRRALAQPGTGDDVFGPAGAGVRAVARHPLALPVFRSLVPSQRQSLAREWAVGLAAIETRYGAVRGFLLKDAYGRRVARRRAVGVRRWFVRNPEWVLAALSLFWLGLAAGRVGR